jgi:hypothetical protein
MREFAKRLIAHEAGDGKFSEPGGSAGFPVIDKLRPQLATLMGKGGFRTLLSRSLALASAKVPWLRAVHVRSDATLEGWEELQAQLHPDKFLEGRVALVAELLELMVAFIGEKLTLHLVREIWSEVSVNDLELANGGKNEKTK